MKFSTIVFSVVLTVMASPLLAQNGGTECPVPDPKAGMKSLCYALKTSVTYDACLKNMSNAAAKGKCFGIPKDPAVTCDNACKDQGVLKKTICSKSCLNFFKDPRKQAENPGLFFRGACEKIDTDVKSMCKGYM